jgi:predicted nucleotidyltransferase
VEHLDLGRELGREEEMDSEQAQHKGSLMLTHCLERLRACKADLHARGVLHVAIFGSVARGDVQEDSDVDVLVEIERGRGFGLSGLLDLQREFEQAFGRHVDVVSKGGLRSPKHDHILREMVQAF